MGIARRFDLIVALRTTFKGMVQDMKAANPRLRLIAYSNGAFALDTEGTKFPDAWYLRSKSGAKVRSVQWGNYLMDPANTGWRREGVTECKAFLAQSGFDGCYLDDLGSGNFDSGNLTALPINPRTHATYTSLQWIADTSALARYVDSSTGRPTIANGLNNGDKYFDPAVRSARLLDGADGANAEGFLRNQSDAPDTFAPEADWTKDVDMLVDAGSRGRSVVAMTKVWVRADADQVTRLRRYAYASFLLGTNGQQYLYFNPVGPGKPPAANPWDGIAIGTPTEHYAKRSGAYQRAFSHGLVVVNPTSSSVTFPLAGTYVDLSGAERRGSMTLGPHGADILRTK